MFFSVIDFNFFCRHKALLSVRNKFFSRFVDEKVVIFYHLEISSEARWQLRSSNKFSARKLFFQTSALASPKLTSNANSRDYGTNNRSKLARLPFEMVYGWVNIWKRG
jgi:hypothetical protein